jgi:phosphatidylglycerol:prolipoprotein diacylglycerol transferase
MAAIGFLAGLAAALRYAGREGIKDEQIYDLFIYVVISAIAGARLAYVVTFPSEFVKNPLSVLYVSQGGLAFVGGLIAVLLAIFVYAGSHKIDVLKLLDALSPAAALGYAIGRIGCYLNGCCYGITLFGIEQPTQLYLSLTGLVILSILAYYYDKKKYDGQIFLIALFLYSICRFFIEFIRYSPVHIGIFTPNQLAVVLIFILSSYALWKKSST